MHCCRQIKSAGNILFHILCSALLLFLLQAGTAVGQTAPSTGAEPSPAEQEAPSDPFGRNTPRGTFSGYIGAVSSQDYSRAAEYLDLSHIPTSEKAAAGRELARMLQMALDRGGNVPPAVMLSEDEEGRQDDGLHPSLDRLGVIDLGDRELPVLVERIEREGEVLWRVSKQTLDALPAILKERNAWGVDQLIPGPLLRVHWQGVSLGHWLAMIVLAVIAYLSSYLIIGLLGLIVYFSVRRRLTEYGRSVLSAFELPLRLYLAVWIFVLAGQEIGIAIVVRQYFGELTFIVAWVAILLLAWRLVCLVAAFAERRVIQRNNLGALSALLFFQRSAKVAVIILGVIIILDTLGFDVSTGLAALGIGGLAVALGAQKTIENLVGSLTLIFDQPVRVGDFCKVGDTVGTVEQIGMRSSRLRTIDRTMVVIPNSEFASQRIENFAHRDRFRFSPVLNLRHETTPDQMRWILVELRAVLFAHPKVDPDPARVRFVGLTQQSLNLEIFSYVLADDFDDFLEVQEDLCLRIMDVIASSGSGFAHNTQTIHIARDSGLAEDRREEVEAQVRDWCERGELDIPKFDPDRAAALRNKIVYPPPGSSAARRSVPRP